MESLRKRILEDVAEYYLHTDPAHRIDHIEKTMDNAMVILERLEMSHQKALIKRVLIAIGYHDVWSQRRKYHHVDAYLEVCKLTRHIQQRYDVTQEDVWRIAHACLEHRASFKGNYDSLISEITAAADRGIPSTEIAPLFYRSYVYARGIGKDRELAKLHCVEHIKEKFGDGGYGAVPVWYNTLFTTELDQRKTLITNFSIHDLDDAKLDELDKAYGLTS